MLFEIQLALMVGEFVGLGEGLFEEILGEAEIVAGMPLISCSLFALSICSKPAAVAVAYAEQGYRFVVYLALGIVLSPALR